MEQVNHYVCSVALGGDARHTSTRRGCTAPELVLLRKIHGDTAVTHISLKAKIETDSDSERTRLTEIYGAVLIREVFGGFADLPMDIKKAKIPKELFALGDDALGVKTQFKSKKTKKEEQPAPAEKTTEENQVYT